MSRPLLCLFCRIRQILPRLVGTISALAFYCRNAFCPRSVYESVDYDSTLCRCDKIFAVSVRQESVTRQPLIFHSFFSHLSQTSYFIRQSATSNRCPFRQVYLRNTSSCFRCLQLAQTFFFVCFRSVCLVMNPSFSISLLINTLSICPCQTVIDR